MPDPLSSLRYGHGPHRVTARSDSDEASRDVQNERAGSHRGSLKRALATLHETWSALMRRSARTGNRGLHGAQLLDAAANAIARRIVLRIGCVVFRILD